MDVVNISSYECLTLERLGGHVKSLLRITCGWEFLADPISVRLDESNVPQYKARAKHIS